MMVVMAPWPTTGNFLWMTLTELNIFLPVCRTFAGPQTPIQHHHIYKGGVDTLGGVGEREWGDSIAKRVMTDLWLCAVEDD